MYRQALPTLMKQALLQHGHENLCRLFTAERTSQPWSGVCILDEYKPAGCEQNIVRVACRMH